MGFQSKRLTFSDRYFCNGPVAKLCRRELLTKVKFDTENFWGEDTIWNLFVTKNCDSIIISPNVWYYAFANEDSQTHTFRKNCEFEFKYRINQESRIIKEQWPECLDGLYAQIWLSTYYLFACYLMHKENNNTDKYKTFIRCIKEPVYREMLRNN